MLVESSVPLAVDRTMRWSNGTHGETAVSTPATTWYLAEGTTVLDFELFYLLQNPGDATSTATVRFLLPGGPPLVKDYTLPPHSRTTVYVNQIATLEETDVSAEITGTAPIVVERATYRSRPGEIYTLGNDARGQSQTATRWFLAEGATGPFFDTYVLIANPGAGAADVTASFLRDDGVVVTQNYTVQPNTRFSIYADGVPGLELGSFATTIDSSVPVVVERAMYWPGGFFDYYEGHVSGGATATGSHWVLAEGETDGPQTAQTFVLIANTTATATSASIRLLLEGQLDALPVVVPIPARSRVTVPVSTLTGPTSGLRHGIDVAETGSTITGGLVVEGAMYGTTDALWSLGTGWLGTRVP